MVRKYNILHSKMLILGTFASIVNLTYTFNALICFQRFSSSQSTLRVTLSHYLPSWKLLFSTYSTFRNPFYTFLISLLVERQLTIVYEAGGRSQWCTKALQKCTALRLWMCCWKLYTHTLFGRQNISVSSLNVGITQWWNVWKRFVISAWGQLGFTATCTQTMIGKCCKC